MPLSRLLMSLCGLLLALAVTAATAAADLYGDELIIYTRLDYNNATWASHSSHCKSVGGFLVPMVTEAVYTNVKLNLANGMMMRTFSYMGGSSLLSSAACTTSAPSLDCIWYWDQGRYSGVENALPFYRGNRDAKDLSDAGMMTTSVANHWHVPSNTERCPCYKMERYGAAILEGNGLIYWSDTNPNNYSYRVAHSIGDFYLCGIEKIQTTTTKPPMNSGSNRPLAVSLPIAAAVVVMTVAAWL